MYTPGCFLFYFFFFFKLYMCIVLFQRYSIKILLFNYYTSSTPAINEVLRKTPVLDSGNGLYSDIFQFHLSSVVISTIAFQPWSESSFRPGRDGIQKSPEAKFCTRTRT